ncbi:MAG: MotA/TolQ/ExbB proton channel family protein [Anaerohalosphaeraceae bacterium]
MSELNLPNQISEMLRFLPEPMQRFLGEAWSIWLSGGWAMTAIAAVGIVMFGLGVHLWLRFAEKGFTRIREKTWRQWLEQPNLRRGTVGRILNEVSGFSTLKDCVLFFEELKTAELGPFERDLRVMKICVGLAPLLGLLGTVTGMLATFSALATGSGGEKTMAMVAGGISEALITTETGLIIALPGLFFHYQLVRKQNRYRAFLAHLETVCTQHLYKQILRSKGDN